MKAQILVVDDEEKVRKVISRYLEEEGFVVETASRGDRALEMALEKEPDLVILDLMLPGLAGEEVAREIRKYSNLPILMLTARSSEREKLEGFERGADDYVVKPFSPRELVARVKAILKRQNYSSRELIEVGDNIIIFPEEARVTVSGEEAGLTATEFKLFQALLENRGRVLSREQLAQRALGFDYNGFDRTIDVHIKNIRKKLSLQKDRLIETVYGMGYRMKDERTDEESEK